MENEDIYGALASHKSFFIHRHPFHKGKANVMSRNLSNKSTYGCTLPRKRTISPLSYKGVLNDKDQKISSKKSGKVIAYAAKTHRGAYRKNNEDRISLVLNFEKPPTVPIYEWPTCSFFGIYDGHGGNCCANFLKDRLHTYIVSNKYFPKSIETAIKEGFANAEKEFLKLADSLNDDSGSCAIVVIVSGNICYVASTGDSRAILSVNKGKTIVQLSKDHKPHDLAEKYRILLHGGRLYQTKGPVRVSPGNLSVSRAFGNIKAKVQKYGGKESVIIHNPDIMKFTIEPVHDFLLIGSDGIFDKLTNDKIAKIIWNENFTARNLTVHKAAGRAVDSLLNFAIENKTLDNVTAILICFDGFWTSNDYRSRNIPLRVHSTERCQKKTTCFTETSIVKRMTTKRLGNEVV